MPADVESGSMNASQRPMMGLDSVETLVEDYSSLSKRDRAEVRNRGWGSGIGLREPAPGCRTPTETSLLVCSWDKPKI
jgi:hypothetical protein